MVNGHNTLAVVDVFMSEGHRPEEVGLIPSFLFPLDPRPVRQQLDEGYAHGGGWHPIKGFKMDFSDMTLRYPGDPVFRPIALIPFRSEVVMVYQFGIVAIVDLKAKTFEVARMD